MAIDLTEADKQINVSDKFVIQLTKETKIPSILCLLHTLEEFALKQKEEQEAVLQIC